MESPHKLDDDWTICPIGPTILVKRDVARKVSEGGIAIPDMAQEKPNEGVVVATGDGEFRVKVDDRVLFPVYAGTSVIIDKEEHILMTEEDLLGILVKEDT